MKTNVERLRIALNFVNGPDVEYHKNVVQLREDLAQFLGYPLLESGQDFPDLDDYWPDTIGGSTYEVTARIDLSATSLHINMGDLSVAKGPAVREGRSDFLGCGAEAVPVPVKVLRQLQNRTRRLINDYLGDREADADHGNRQDQHHQRDQAQVQRGHDVLGRCSHHQRH